MPGSTPDPAINPTPRTADAMFIDRETYRTAVQLSRSLRTSNPKRLALTEVLFGLHRAVVRLDEVARRVDDLAFPGYRDVEVDRPTFIVANPRSGTTFLHRLMCLDDRFFHLKLYQTILPAVSLFKLIDSAEEANKFLGGLFSRGVDAIEERFFSGWEDIHPLGFDRAEEDEGLFILSLLSPGLYLLFPELAQLPRPAAIDDLEADTRRRVMDFYEGSLKRIKSFEGPDKRFLGKSALMPGRIHSMLDRFPEARFIHLVRHPYKTVPSFVSMFRLPWRAFASEIDDASPQTRQLADIAIDYYHRMEAARERIGPDQLKTIRFQKLVGQTRQTVEEIYDWIDEPLDPSFAEALDAELARKADYSSSHHYSLDQFGLTRGEIYGRLKPIFERYDFEP